MGRSWRRAAGRQAGRQQRGVRAEPGGTWAEPAHPETCSVFSQHLQRVFQLSTYNSPFPLIPALVCRAWALPENILLLAGYVSLLCPFLWSAGANLSPCLSPVPCTPAVLRHPPAGTSLLLLTYLRRQVPGGEAAIPLLTIPPHALCPHLR